MERSAERCKQREADIASHLNEARLFGLQDSVGESMLRDIIADYFAADSTDDDSDHDDFEEAERDDEATTSTSTSRPRTSLSEPTAIIEQLSGKFKANLSYNAPDLQYLVR